MTAGDVGVVDERRGTDDRERVRHRWTEAHPAIPLLCAKRRKHDPRLVDHPVGALPVGGARKAGKFHCAGQTKSAFHGGSVEGTIGDQDRALQADARIFDLGVISAFRVERNVTPDVRSEPLREGAGGDNDGGPDDTQTSIVRQME